MDTLKGTPLDYAPEMLPKYFEVVFKDVC